MKALDILFREQIEGLEKFEDVKKRYPQIKEGDTLVVNGTTVNIIDEMDFSIACDLINMSKSDENTPITQLARSIMESEGTEDKPGIIPVFTESYRTLSVAYSIAFMELVDKNPFFDALVELQTVVAKEQEDMDAGIFDSIGEFVLLGMVSFHCGIDRADSFYGHANIGTLLMEIYSDGIYDHEEMWSNLSLFDDDEYIRSQISHMRRGITSTTALEILDTVEKLVGLN